MGLKIHDLISITGMVRYLRSQNVNSNIMYLITNGKSWKYNIKKEKLYRKTWFGYIKVRNNYRAIRR